MSCWSIQLRGRLGCLHTTHPLRIYTYIHTLYGITEISSVLCCCSEPTKISRKYLEDGTKVRVSKKTGTIIPKPDPLADRKPRSIGMLRSEALYVFMYVCMYVFIEHRRHQLCQQDLKFMYVCMYFSINSDRMYVSYSFFFLISIVYCIHSYIHTHAKGSFNCMTSHIHTTQ